MRRVITFVLLMALGSLCQSAAAEGMLNGQGWGWLLFLTALVLGFFSVPSPKEKTSTRWLKARSHEPDRSARPV